MFVLNKKEKLKNLLLKIFIREKFKKPKNKDNFFFFRI